MCTSTWKEKYCHWLLQGINTFTWMSTSLRITAGFVFCEFTRENLYKRVWRFHRTYMKIRVWREDGLVHFLLGDKQHQGDSSLATIYCKHYLATQSCFFFCFCIIFKTLAQLLLQYTAHRFFFFYKYINGKKWSCWWDFWYVLKLLCYQWHHCKLACESTSERIWNVLSV